MPRRRSAASSGSRPADRLAAGVRDLRVARPGSSGGRVLLVLGGVLAPLGLLVILLGWYGASRTSNVFEQVPYLISGGLLGLALVFLGAFLYFGHWLTRLVQEHRAGSAAIVDAVTRLAEAVDRQSASLGANGHLPAAAPAPAPAPPTDDLVLVATGSGTLAHRPTCRVVAGKPDLRTVAPAEGLAPCRLCHPDA